MKNIALGLIATVFAGTSFAQAVVSDVTGLVTSTQGNQLVNVTNGVTLPEGAQVQLTSGAKASLSFQNGCKVTLGSGQSMLVTNSECLRVAALPSGVGAGGGLLSNPFMLAASGALGAAALREATRTSPTVTPPLTTAPVTPLSPS